MMRLQHESSRRGGLRKREWQKETNAMGESEYCQDSVKFQDMFNKRAMAL